MAASAGLVWFGQEVRTRFSRRKGSQGGSPSQLEPPIEPAEKSERRARLEAKADEIVREEVLGRSSPASPLIDEAAQLDDAARDDAARDDALHDMGFPRGSDPSIEVTATSRETAEDLGIIFDPDAGREAGDFDIDFEVDDTRRDPQEVEWPGSGETVSSHQHFTAPDESYDAMDAEDIGTQWLNRATEAMPIEGRDPIDELEGTNVIDMSGVDSGLVEERNFGADQEPEPLEEYAGTHEEDIAARLPVGAVDENGNVQLRAPITPPDAFNAPPTSELSPTEEELERRAAAAEAARRRRR